MKKITVIALLAIVFTLAACGSSQIKKILPVETETREGETIEKVEPQRTGDRDNVPADIKPSQVITHIKTKTGGEIWIAKKGSEVEIYQNPQAKTEGITIDRPKKSYAWIFYIVGFVASLFIIDFILRRFLGFNPIAMFFKFIGQILKKIFTRKNK